MSKQKKPQGLGINNAEKCKRQKAIFSNSDPYLPSRNLEMQQPVTKHKKTKQVAKADSAPKSLRDEFAMAAREVKNDGDN